MKRNTLYYYCSNINNNITQLTSNTQGNTIKVASNNKDRATKGVGDSDGEVNEVDIIDITNARFVKLNSQSQSKTTKSKNLI